MSDKITLVTFPDDTYSEGLRILLYDLNQDQYSLFSQCMLNYENFPSLIVYSSDHFIDITWTIDKLYKSDLIIFNAESENHKMVGYLSSKINSYYFGNLGDLSLVNSSVIFDVYQLEDILKRRFEKYGKF
jgi:hypothetical protein